MGFCKTKIINLKLPTLAARQNLSWLKKLNTYSEKIPIRIYSTSKLFHINQFNLLHLNANKTLWIAKSSINTETMNLLTEQWTWN